VPKPSSAPGSVFPGIAVAVRSSAAGAVKSADVKAAHGGSQARHFRPLRVAGAARCRLEPWDHWGHAHSPSCGVALR